MMFDDALKQELANYLKLMESDLSISFSIGEDQASLDMKQMLDELTELTDRIKIEAGVLDRTPSFSIHRADGPTGISFAGVPLGNEFTYLVLAFL